MPSAIVVEVKLGHRLAVLQYIYVTADILFWKQNYQIPRLLQGNL